MAISTDEAVTRPTEGGGRLVSLDVFRGITIAAMILVNNAGDWSHVYPPLLHAEWDGWTPTDLVFPFFLFIMGVAIPYSFAKRISIGQSRGKLLKHVIVRSILIFALGMLLSGIPNFNYSHRLILNILQRIGIIYLLSGAIYLYTGIMAQAIIGVLLITLYWLAMFLVPVPGYGAGVLTPVGNLWWYVDEVLLRGWHQHIFYVGSWKLEHAEGILSLIPSVSTVLFGVLTGHYLRSDKTKIEKASGMMVYGNFGLFIGIIMSIWFPINKLLWSSSYVVFTAGFALEVFGICYWLIDIKGIKWWSRPFLVFGTNAITSFFLSTLFALILDLVKIHQNLSSSQVVSTSLKEYIYKLIFAPIGNPYNASLLYAIVYVILWYIVMEIFYRRKIFIKI